LSDIAVVGPVDIYGAHLRMERSLTTVQNAMKRLEEQGYVKITKREEGKTGQTKKIYSLTFLGFCTATVIILTASKSAESLETVRDAIRLWNSEFGSIILKKWDFLMESYAAVPMDVEHSFRLMLFDALEYACQTGVLLWRGLFVPKETVSDSEAAHLDVVLERFESSFFQYVLSQPVPHRPAGGDRLDMFAYKVKKDPEIWHVAREFIIEEMDFHKTMACRFERILGSGPQR